MTAGRPSIVRSGPGSAPDAAPGLPAAGSSSGVRLIVTVFLAFAVIFPFVPRILDRDLQPLYLILLTLWIAVGADAKISRRVLTLAVLAALILAYRARFGYDLYDLSRGLVFYLTPVLMVVFIRNLRPPEARLLVTVARASLHLYVAFGFIQYLGLNAMNLLEVSRMTADRGVSSFGPEPSMFGFVLTAIAVFLASNQRLRTLDFVVFVAGIIICGAASAILTAIPLIVGAIVALVAQSRYKLLYGASLVAFLGTTIFVSGELLPARVLGLLSFRGELADFNDFSVLERLGHVYFVFFQNSLLTGGSAPWGVAYLAFIGQNDVFRFGSDVNNILSSLGAVVYDGGILGFAFLFCLYRFSEMRKLGIYSQASVFLLAIQSMSFAVPVLWLAAFSGLMKKN